MNGSPAGLTKSTFSSPATIVNTATSTVTAIGGYWLASYIVAEVSVIVTLYLSCKGQNDKNFARRWSDHIPGRRSLRRASAVLDLLGLPLADQVTERDVE